MGTRRNDALEQFSNGTDLLSASNLTATGEFYGMLALADTIISAITETADHENFSNVESGNDAVTIVRGQYIPVGFTDITITSGALLIGKDY